MSFYIFWYCCPYEDRTSTNGNGRLYVVSLHPYFGNFTSLVSRITLIPIMIFSFHQVHVLICPSLNPNLLTIYIWIKAKEAKCSFFSEIILSQLAFLTRIVHSFNFLFFVRSPLTKIAIISKRISFHNLFHALFLDKHFSSKCLIFVASYYFHG